MSFQTTNRFCVSAEVLSQEVNDETVLLDFEGESYFGLNEVGTRVWQLLQSEPSVAEMLSTLSDEYDVSMAQLESDLDDLLVKLADAGLIQLRGD